MNTSQLWIEIMDDKMICRTPYSNAIVNWHHRHHCVWNPDKKFWIADPRDEDSFRKQCKRTYGHDGSDFSKVVDIVLSLTAENSVCLDGLYWGGILLARASGRDSGAKIGSEVIHISGKIGSAGSRAYWTTSAQVGFQVEIRDVHPDTPFGWTNLKNGSFTWKVIRENGKKIENQVDGESGIEKPDPEKESA